MQFNRYGSDEILLPVVNFDGWGRLTNGWQAFRLGISVVWQNYQDLRWLDDELRQMGPAIGNFFLEHYMRSESLRVNKILHRMKYHFNFSFILNLLLQYKNCGAFVLVYFIFFLPFCDHYFSLCSSQFFDFHLPSKNFDFFLFAFFSVTKQ